MREAQARDLLYPYSSQGAAGNIHQHKSEGADSFIVCYWTDRKDDQGDQGRDGQPAVLVGTHHFKS